MLLPYYFISSSQETRLSVLYIVYSRCFRLLENTFFCCPSTLIMCGFWESLNIFSLMSSSAVHKVCWVDFMVSILDLLDRIQILFSLFFLNTNGGVKKGYIKEGDQLGESTNLVCVGCRKFNSNSDFDLCRFWSNSDFNLLERSRIWIFNFGFSFNFHI